MKRQIYIQVIKDFILEKPGRTYQEIQEYATEVNATSEELEQAIALAGEILKKSSSSGPLQNPKAVTYVKAHHKRKSVKQMLDSVKSIDFTPGLAGKTIAIASLSGVMILAISSLYLYSRLHNLSEQLNTTSAPVSSAFIADSNPASSLFSTFAEPVYANQKIVNANEIFSYPPSDVTLRYTGSPKKDIFGFFPYWMMDAIDKVNTIGYTDIALFGLTSDGKGNIITASEGVRDSGWQMWNDPRLDTFIKNLQRKGTRVHLVVKSFNNSDIESIISSDENQARLIANIVQLVQSKSLDGVNIDFEYVGKGEHLNRDDFTRFIANLNTELKRQVPEAQLTLDTYASSGTGGNFFDVAELAKHSDAIVVMGYDIHTPSGAAGPVAPLEGGGGLVGYMESYLSRVPADKLILALPYYGYDWVVSPNPSQSIRSQSKTLPYATIAQVSKKSKINWDEVSKTPYYNYKDAETGSNRIVHFDNARSLGLKYDFIKERDLKGVGIWAMGYDGYNQDLHQVLLDKFAN